MAMAGRRSARSQRARRVHRRPHPADRGLEADEDRLADQEVADVELAHLAAAPRPGRRCRRSGRARHAPRGRGRGRRPPSRVSRASSRAALGGVAGEARLAVGAGVQLDHRRADPVRRLDLPAVGGDEDRDAAAGLAQRRDEVRRAGSRRCATSSPPSVVRSSRRSGTRQTACGRWRSAIACISSVAAISRLSGSVSSAISAAMSASVMWRRSSRRCAVMPSAPAASASLRGAQRVGIGAAAGVAHRRDVVDVHAEPQPAAASRRSWSACASGSAVARLIGRRRPALPRQPLVRRGRASGARRRVW